jgi:phosphatidate cytidylyltransferase
VKKSLLSPRVATALVAIPVVILIIWWGGILFKLVSLMLAFLGLAELGAALERSEKFPDAKLIKILAYPILFVMIWWAPGTSFLGPMILLATLLTIAVLVYGPGGKVSLLSVCFTLAATLYCALFAFLPLLRNSGDGNKGMMLFCLTTFSVWASDTAAYYGGRALGRKPLTPLSPGKTLEGALCGAVGAVVTASGIAGSAGLTYWMGILLGVVIAIAAPMGDLVESFWKRELGVKDMGTLLPGHGGVLDRCDSLIFTAFAVYSVLGIRH